MTTLILYATKYGAAHEIAQRILNRMDNAVLHNLKDKNIPPLDQFECIIIGSSLYASSIRKEAREFLALYANNIKDKKIGLFLSGIGGNDTKSERRYFFDNFPDCVLKAAKIAIMLGGVFDPKKAGLFERLIIKIVTKKTSYINTISDEKINLFVEALTGV
jgi:menaquinone-dependent protoporphyrinogen oxidase